jgi:hypothetical protein
MKKMKKATLVVAIASFALLLHGLFFYSLGMLEFGSIQPTVDRSSDPSSPQAIIVTEQSTSIEEEELSEVFDELEPVGDSVDESRETSFMGHAQNSEVPAAGGVSTETIDFRNLQQEFSDSPTAKAAARALLITARNRDMLVLTEMPALPKSESLATISTMPYMSDSLQFSEAATLLDDLVKETNFVEGLTYGPQYERSADEADELSDPTNGQEGKVVLPKSIVAFGPNHPGRFPSSEEFRTSIEYAPAPNQDGYLFALTLQPKQPMELKSVRKNVYFLIDRSRSLPIARFEAFKQGVKKALRWMKPGDTFNVVLFDKRITKLSPDPLVWNEQNVLEADAFLDRMEHGGMFATTDLYSSLNRIVPSEVPDTELNTAILLTDGDTYLRQSEQRRAIADWTKENSGRVALFTAATGRNNNLALLELLAFFNRGRLLYSPLDSGVDQLLKEIIVTTKDPIGKDLMVTAVPQEDATEISLYPSEARLPDLYAGVPYTVMGWVNEPKPFTLFLQGRFYDSRFDIKKTVAFDTKMVDAQELARNISINRAYEHYQEFLSDGRVNHLREAGKVLKKLKIPVAFR